jgi:hypothetical protein
MVVNRDNCNTLNETVNNLQKGTEETKQPLLAGSCHEFNFDSYDSDLSTLIGSTCSLILQQTNATLFSAVVNFEMPLALGKDEDGAFDKFNSSFRINEYHLKLRVLRKICSILTECLKFGDFLYLNIKNHQTLGNGKMLFSEEFDSSGEHKVNVKVEMSIVIASRLLLGNSELFLASLNLVVSRYLRTGVNFKASVFLNAENTIWDDKLWGNHLFYIFYPYLERFSNIPEYNSISAIVGDFCFNYEAATAILFFVYQDKLESKLVDFTRMGINNKEDDFTYNLLARGFNEENYFCAMALINLVRFYCYKNNILVVPEEQPSLTILWNRIINIVYKKKNGANNNLDENLNRLVYVRELKIFLEHVFYVIRADYSQRYPDQIDVKRLDRLIEQYGNQIIRLILLNPRYYLPYKDC